MQSVRIREFSHGFETYLTVIICALGLFHCTCSAETWHTEVIDEDLSFSGFQDRSFVSDSNGTLHVLLKGNRLIYAECPEGGEWETEEIAPSPCGLEASMAVSETGVPHIAFYDPDAKRLFHATRDEAGWQIEPVGDLYLAGRYNSICLDSIDNPAISFLAHSPLRLCVAHLYDFGWDVETIWGVDVYEHSTSIGIDASGKTYIAIRQEQYSYGLVVGVTGDWTCLQIIENNYCYYGPVIRVNPSSDLFIVCRRSAGMFCGRISGTEVHWEMIPSHSNGHLADTRFTPSGLLTMLTYYYSYSPNSPQQYLEVVVREADRWSLHTIDSERLGIGIFDQFTYCIDRSNQVHIGGFHDVELIHFGNVFGSSCLKTIATGYSVEEPCISLRILDGPPSIVYLRKGWNQLILAEKTSGEWKKEVAVQGSVEHPLGSFSMTTNRVAEPVICYNAGDSLWLAVKSGSGWHYEIVREGGLVGQVKFDEEEREHLVYYVRNGDELDLEYSRRIENGGWSSERIFPNVRTAGSRARLLDIDQMNRPHVAFRRGGGSLHSTTFYYGVRTEEQWQITELSSYDSECSDMDFMLGPEGDLHLAHTSHGGCPGGGDYHVIYTKRCVGDPDLVLNHGLGYSYNCVSLQIDRHGLYHLLGRAGGLTHAYAFKDHGSRNTELDSLDITSDIDQVTDSNDTIHAVAAVQSNPLYEEIDSYNCIMYMNLAPMSAGVRLQNYQKPWKSRGILKANVYHDSLETLPAALIVAMQVGDQFWFYPSWTGEFHAHPIELLPAKYGAEYTILNHPFTTDAEFHLTFWAALMTPDLTQIIGGDDGIDSIDITCSPW